MYNKFLSDETKFRFEDNMTDMQLAVIAQFRTDVNELLNTFISRRDTAIAAVAKLPCATERGTPVLFGANKHMYRIMDSYQIMIDELATYADNLNDSRLRKPKGF